MKKSKELNGVVFEVVKSKHTQDMIDFHREYERKDLCQCYANPSEAKREIYTEWVNWAFGMFPDVWNFGITSYNQQTFTLGGILYSEDDEIIGYLKITKAHNRLYLL